MLDCLKRGCQRFTPGARAPSCWVTSFMTAALEEKSGSKQCSRRFLFFALCCQRADKSIRAVFPFRVLIVAISSSVQEFRRSRIWLSLIGFGVSMRSFRLIFPLLFLNKQVIKMEMGKTIRQRLTVKVFGAAAGVWKERRPWKMEKLHLWHKALLIIAFNLRFTSCDFGLSLCCPGYGPLSKLLCCLFCLKKKMLVSSITGTWAIFNLSDAPLFSPSLSIQEPDMQGLQISNGRQQVDAGARANGGVHVVLQRAQTAAFALHTGRHQQVCDWSEGVKEPARFLRSFAAPSWPSSPK